MTDIVALKNDLIEGMAHYMKYGAAESEQDPDYDPEFDAGYTQHGVDRCGAILDTFLASLAGLDAPPNEAQVMEAVKKAVLALNALNEQCGGGLIETDQREQICELIIGAANNAGLKTEEDITEEWREW
jgi:hypothetical protein